MSEILEIINNRIESIALALVTMEGEDIPVPSTFIVRQDRTIHWKHVGETMADRPANKELPALADKAR